jgi:hypothetical protein
MLQAGRSPIRVPDEVDFCNLRNPSSRTMALGSTQSLTEMNTSGQRVGLMTLPPSVSRMPENVGASTSRKPKGLNGLYRDIFTFLPYGHHQVICANQWKMSVLQVQICLNNEK